MGAVAVLKDVEDFLRKVLAAEVLSTRTKSKRAALLTRVTGCIANLEEQNKLDDFLAKQRQASRLQSIESDQADGKVPSDEADDGEYYMDLAEIQTMPGEENVIVLPGTESWGSGSGYESYASEDETSSRAKTSKEEDLSAYFMTSECEIFTYVYLENKNKFLKGKKWVKRVGVVKENQLKCYKKPSDSQAVLNIPLRAYNATLKNREGTSSIMIVLSAPGDGEAHKFSVERDVIDGWAKVLREKTLSLTNGVELPPPPVAARPLSTLPRVQPSQATANGVAQDASIRRASSIGVVDIGKGIKSAMTDMFKKDKNKQRIMTAENLGADICGHLMVFDNHTKWVKKWCLVNRNQLFVYGKEEQPDFQLELQGCDLLLYSDDPERQFGFKLLRDGKEFVRMEATSSTEMGRWVGLLIAETGCAELPRTEPEYMSFDIRDAVSTAAKQAFLNRRETMSKKTGPTTFNKKYVEEEELYIDLATATDQITDQTIVPRMLPSPPLPPSRERTSVTQSVVPDLTVMFGNVKAASKTSKKPATKQSDAVDGKAVKDKLSDCKRLKQKSPERAEGKDERATSSVKKGRQKAHESGDEKSVNAKKERRKGKHGKRLSSSDITLPGEILTTIDAGCGKGSSSLESPPHRLADVNGNSTGLKKSLRENVIEKRKQELTTRKSDIKMRIHTLSVKKDTLDKYIEGAKSEKERGRFRMMLQKATDEHGELEKEDVSLELELRKLKDQSYGIDSPANKRPLPRAERRVIDTGASGNVMNKAKIWEMAGNK